MPQWPNFDEEQIAAVAAVLRSGKVNAWTGPDVARFEAAYCAYTGAPHAIALANGSVSLDCALRALQLPPGGEVIVTPRSFIASASAVLLAGGVPVFADVDPDSQNITAATIAPLITRRTCGILPVHLGGWPCGMKAIMDLARAHGLWVIEDCAQAHGAMTGGRHVGTFGDFGSFSFCQDKIISTGGEGGMLITGDKRLWSRAWSYKDHGKDYAAVFNRTHPPGFRWLHNGPPGSNLRMAGPAAAIGRLQLARLGEWRARRTANAQILALALAPCSALRVPLPPQGVKHAYYRFYAFVRREALAPGWSRDRILAEITAAGFPAFSGSCAEIYREELFRRLGLGPARRLRNARQLGETSLAFLTDPSWSLEDMHRLAECVRRIAGQAAARQRPAAKTRAGKRRPE